MHNNNSNNQLVFESLEYKDLEGMMKPTIHVDEFTSKMGDDDDIIVVSFFVRDDQAAKDLMQWFEKGYDFVLDADKSPGELKPNRYLVYCEIRRRSTAAEQIKQLLEDLNTLTEFDVGDWMVHYRDEEFPFSAEALAAKVPMTPRAYREKFESDLNEMRGAAGLPTRRIYDQDDKLLQSIQSAAGIL